MAVKHGQLPHLRPAEVTLLDYAADDSRDIVSLSEKEQLVLQLANQIQEQRLEKALLEQEPESLSGDNVEEALEEAERELLEARTTHTVRRKATRTVLMTDPILKSVHLKSTIPPEKGLLRLLNRRDVLALAQENLASAHSAVLNQLSNSEVENIKINEVNQKLVSELLELTKEDSSWRERLQDVQLASQLDNLEAELKTSQAKWNTMKSIASAMVVGSGLDWADDDDLRALVLDESDD